MESSYSSVISPLTYRLSLHTPLLTFSGLLLDGLLQYNSDFRENKAEVMPNIPKPISAFAIQPQDMEFILQHVEDGILCHDPHQKILYSNISAANLLGFPTIETLIRYAQIHEGILDNEQYIYQDSYNNPITLRDLPWQQITLPNVSREAVINITHKNTGTIKRLHIKSQYKKTSLGTFLIISKIVDITNVATLERQKDDFMSMASHELKTPITSMKVFTQALQRFFEKNANTEPIYYLGKIEGQLDKLTMLIRELLDVSRLQTGRLELHKEIFDIDEVIMDVCEQMQYTTDNHTIAFRPHFGKKIFADKERLSQVLVNLISNAIKYSPENTSIVVGSFASKSSVVITVKDQGIGIGQTRQKHIFDRFSKSNGEGENTFPGMGVGLYIVSQIIKRHNGTIAVKSKKKRGSTFIVTLPLFYENER